MAAAEVQIQVAHGAGPSMASAEGGVVWNRTDDELGVPASRIPIPASAPASNYSNYKFFQFAVITAGDTTISDLSIRKSGAEPSGSKLFYGTPGSYVQCTGDGATQGNRPADSASALAASPDPNTPASYTVVPTTAHIFDTDDYDASVEDVFGDLIPVLVGVSSSYADGAGAAKPQSSLIFGYTEV